MHFARGRDASRAVHYLHDAADNALQRSAYQEAITHLTQGLELLTSLPDASERAQHELRFLTKLGLAFVATKGQAHLDVRALFRACARTLSPAGGLAPAVSGVGWAVLVSRRAVRTQSRVRRRRSALRPGRARTRHARCVWSRTGRSDRPCSSRGSWRRRACIWNKASNFTNDRSTTTSVSAPDFLATSACSAAALRPIPSGISATRTRRCAHSTGAHPRSRVGPPVQPRPRLGVRRHAVSVSSRDTPGARGSGDGDRSVSGTRICVLPCVGDGHERLGAHRQRPRRRRHG